MTFEIPRLDDRSYEDLIDELIRRIPAHTPEWTSPQPGDPGRTLLELFAWLADTILYRANLIPERQRLAFLRLLGASPRPARPARGLVTLHFPTDPQSVPPAPITLSPLCSVEGPVPFETLRETTLHPISEYCCIKRRATAGELRDMAPILEGLRSLYGLKEMNPYVTTQVFATEAETVPLAQSSIDQTLWMALLAPTPTGVAHVREGLEGEVLHVGLAPAQVTAPVPGEPEPVRVLPHVWEVCRRDPVSGNIVFVGLDALEDTTRGLLDRGVVTLRMPGGLDAPPNDPGLDLYAGVGEGPPRIDDPEVAARIVTWLRLRPTQTLERLALGWAGVNAVPIEQRRTLRGILLGTSDGSGGQSMALGASAVDADSLRIEVEEPGRGFVPWHRTDFLATHGREDAVYQLQPSTGVISFGDDIRGRAPTRGMRIRVQQMRVGGGSAGNLKASVLESITARTIDGVTPPPLTLTQPLSTTGGQDAETLAEAERRIPLMLRHRDRAVTSLDIRALAVETPGVRLGRVEVLPRFKPHDLETNVPGALTVMVWPYQTTHEAPAPRADTLITNAVHAWLSERKVLGTELYVIGPQYVAMGASVSVRIREGFDRGKTLLAVRHRVREHFFALSPGGHAHDGWPLGERVSALELEVVVARIEGVAAVTQVRLFVGRNGSWTHAAAPSNADAKILMQAYQLPELVSLRVVEGERAPESLPDGSDLRGEGRNTGVGIPVVPEVC